MSDENSQRTLATINQEYSNALCRLGEIHYAIEKKLPEEQDDLIHKIARLHKEGEIIHKKEQKAKEAEKSLSEIQSPENQHSNINVQNVDKSVDNVDNLAQ